MAPSLLGSGFMPTIKVVGSDSRFPESRNHPGRDGRGGKGGCEPFSQGHQHDQPRRETAAIDPMTLRMRMAELECLLAETRSVFGFGELVVIEELLFLYGRFLAGFDGKKSGMAVIFAGKAEKVAASAPEALVIAIHEGGHSLSRLAASVADQARSVAMETSRLALADIPADRRSALTGFAEALAASAREVDEVAAGIP